MTVKRLSQEQVLPPRDNIPPLTWYVIAGASPCSLHLLTQRCSAWRHILQQLPGQWAGQSLHTWLQLLLDLHLPNGVLE
ncbi:hypothetical protein NMG60_11001674 [Bertholletia excelsa]